MTCSEIRMAASTFAMSLAAISALAMMTGCEDKSADKSGAQASFFVDSIKTSQIMPEEFNSYGYPKKKLFNMQACLKDTGLMAPILGQEFTIEDELGRKTQRMTDAKGCLMWDEHHEFNFFAPEAFISLKRTIRAVRSHKGAVSVDLALNPWSEQLFDLRYDVPNTMEQAKPIGAFATKLSNSSEKSSTFDVKNLSLQFLNIDYDHWEVDRTLALTVAHSYRLRFEPKIYRKGLKSPVIIETPVRGKIRVTMVVFKDEKGSDWKPDQYVTHYDGVVDLQVGGVFQDVTLKFPDISAVASRMRAFVHIEPVGDEASIGSIDLVAPFGPLPAGASMQLVPSNVNAITALSQVQEWKAKLTTSKMQPMDLFHEVSGYRLVTAKDWSRAETKSSRFKTGFDLQQIMGYVSKKSPAPDKATLQLFQKRLCQEVYGASLTEAEIDEASRPERGSWIFPNMIGITPEMINPQPLTAQRALRKCYEKPEETISLEVREFVDTLENPTPRRTGLVQSETLSVQSAFSITENVSESDATSSKWTKFGYNVEGSLGASFDVGFGLLDWKSPGGLTAKGGFSGKVNASVKSGYNKEWFWSYSRSVDQKSSTSVSASMGRSATVEAYALDIDVAVKKCVIAAAKLSPTDVAKRDLGVYFCGTDVEHKVAREAYFLVNQTSAGSSPIVDGALASEMPWRMFIRGAHVYNGLKRTLTDSRLELVLEPMAKDEGEISALSAKAREVFTTSRLTQDFPGMLTPPLRAASAASR
jgi:hypothetical protein